MRDWAAFVRSRLALDRGGPRDLAADHEQQRTVVRPEHHGDDGKRRDVERGQVLNQIALWTVASYEPDSARRLNEVPEVAFDDNLHEWRVREAMARGDWRAALAALRKMPAKLRNDSRWRYFEARMEEKTGDKAEAQRLYREAAQSATFHGFLAADRLNHPYALCAWTPKDTAQAKNAVARDAAIVRAMELWKLERPGWATSEWNDALSRFDDTQRRIAVEVARDNGWFDRAVFSLGKAPDEQRLYELRFPLHHGDTIRRDAGYGFDTTWDSKAKKIGDSADSTTPSSGGSASPRWPSTATGRCRPRTAR